VDIGGYGKTYSGLVEKWTVIGENILVRHELVHWGGHFRLCTDDGSSERGDMDIKRKIERPGNCQLSFGDQEREMTRVAKRYRVGDHQRQ
jgi:hypothetical protein